MRKKEEKLRKTEESWGKERKAEEKEGGDLLKEVRIQRRGRRTHSNWFYTLESNITMATFYPSILETTIHSAVQCEGKSEGNEDLAEENRSQRLPNRIIPRSFFLDSFINSCFQHPIQSTLQQHEHIGKRRRKMEKERQGSCGIFTKWLITSDFVRQYMHFGDWR